MKMKLRTILISSYALMISLGLFIAFFGIFSMNSVDKEISGKVQVQAENTSLAEQIMSTLLKMELALDKAQRAETGMNPAQTEKTLTEYIDRISTNLDVIKKNQVGEDSSVILERFVFEWSFLQNALHTVRQTAGAAAPEIQKSQFNRMQLIMENFVEKQRQTMNASIKKTNTYTTRSRLNMILILIGCFTGAVGIALMIIRLIQSKIGGDPDFVAGIAERIVSGDLEVDFHANPSGVYAALQNVVKSLKQVVEQANRVAQGDYKTEIVLRSKQDTLSLALQQMNKNLLSNNEYNKEQNWLKDGLNKLSSEISGNVTLQQLTDKSISYLGRYLQAGRGVLFVTDQDKHQLQLLSSYAYTERDRVSSTFQYGEGVIGQVALEKKPILMKNMGIMDSEIISGTVSAIPNNTYTFPLIYENELYGVIELAFTQQLKGIEQDFLLQASTILATYINANQQKQQIQYFLDVAQEAQAAAEEKARTLQAMNAQLEEQQQQIQQQTEELQQSNAQLEEQQQQLQQQTEELQQSNAQLEEQQQQLQQQQEEMQQTNESLMLAKVDLDKRAQELELSNQYKSEFLANMSHELRTPLNSILMLSKLIARNDKGNMQEDDIKKANVIHTSGEELLRLINDILDLSKIEAGKNSVKVTSIDLISWEKELHDYFAQIAQNKGLDFTINNNVRTRISTDSDKVSQILRNFISNAIKFTHQGYVRVNFDLTDHPLRPLKLEIADSGIGIAEDQQRRIFDAFHQVDSSISREFGGTGLGLTIAQRLAGLLNGEITMSSEMGKGSIFTLWLPLNLDETNPIHDEADKVIRSNPVTKAEKTPPAPKQTAYQLPAVIDDDRSVLDKNKQCFLIIEDDHVFASIVGNIIHSMSMQFIHAGSADVGIKMAQHYKPDGIILDISLPDANGVELLRTIKSSRELKHIPVQIISSHDKNPEAIAIGARDFIQKPVEEWHIKDALVGMINSTGEGKKQLLIVEDNEVQRSVLQEYITDENTQVSGVASEAEALTELKTGSYDAVIVDLGLSQGSGLSLCKKIRQQKLLLPIIVYTGKDLSEAEEKQIKQFADRIIIKTINSVKRLVDELAVFLHKVQKEELTAEPKPQVLNNIGGSLEGKKILIVDDDIKNVFVLSSTLENKGMIIHDAQNGKVALEMMQQEEYDLILMDIMMPVMDGFTTMRHIRADEKLKHTPIIALTAKALKEDRGKCIEAGANDYIAKPINYEGLLNLIQAWIHRKV